MQTKIRTTLIAAAFGVAVATATAFVPGRADNAPHAVTIDNFALGPAQLTVARGTVVTWTNKDDDPHTVVSAGDPKLLKSPPLDTNETYAFTFDAPGTYKYFCSVHPRMQGTILVQ